MKICVRLLYRLALTVVREDGARDGDVYDITRLFPIGYRPWRKRQNGSIRRSFLVDDPSGSAILCLRQGAHPSSLQHYRRTLLPVGLALHKVMQVRQVMFVPLYKYDSDLLV